MGKHRILSKKTLIISLISIVTTFPLQEMLATKNGEKPLRRTVAHTVLSPDYKRQIGENGLPAPERYALGIGKRLDPTEGDDSLSALSFEEMAVIVAKGLAQRNYIAESDSDKTDLLIVVNWGKSIPFHDELKATTIIGMANAMNSITSLNSEIAEQSIAGQDTQIQSSELSAQQGELQSMLLMQDMNERARRKANEYNAQLLGFAPDLYQYYEDNPIGGPQRQIYDDLVEEIESERYFVILQAFDFQELIEKGNKKIVWITRFSMRAKGRSFDEEFANMTSAASVAFGEKTKRIKRGLIPGNITLGELEVIED